VINYGVNLNTKAIALTIVFAALAIALSPIAIPAGYLSGFFYRFWEIPIVAAFLLLGPKSGVIVAVLRTVAELTLFTSPAGVLGPPVTFLVTLNMLLGVYAAYRLLKRKASQDENLGSKPVMYFTALGTFSRVVLSTFVTYVLFRFLLPLVGFSFSDTQIMALIPVVMLFDLTLSLYTIPIGYLMARIVSRNLKIGNQL
jgi:riboflavin transporter FmnP